MAAPALDAAPVELEIKVPGGGGPGIPGSGDPGRGGGGGGDDETPRVRLYKLGLAIALTSITSLFIAVSIIYYNRSRVPEFWEPIRAPGALWLSTGILLLSSWMIELARGALVTRRWFVYRRRLLLTSFLGFAFMAAQLIALAQLVKQGYYVRGNPHASVFYIFTGLHGIHLMGGMAVLNYLLVRRGKKYQFHRMVSSLVAVYWHFMGLVWIALFVILMLL